MLTLGLILVGWLVSDAALLVALLFASRDRAAERNTAAAREERRELELQRLLARIQAPEAPVNTIVADAVRPPRATRRTEDDEVRAQREAAMAAVELVAAANGLDPDVVPPPPR